MNTTNKSTSTFTLHINDLFEQPVKVQENLITLATHLNAENEQQTNQVFSAKWKSFGTQDDSQKLYDFQKRWYLDLYGFNDEQHLAEFLTTRKVIIDAGCGMGYKAAWFAELAPQALVIGIDYSDAAFQAAAAYSHINNLFFVKGDIAQTGIHTASCDYVSCDQVIMHTEFPEQTFSELCRITEPHGGQFACYFYAKKALPRELLDDYFRTQCKSMSNAELWTMSEQLTALGKTLSELNISIDVPDIPALGIKGGQQDLQRFIYWNLLKCFWNAELGQQTSVVTNFDWYSPSNAKRFSELEVTELVKNNNMLAITFHREEACYSGRFKHLTADATLLDK